VERRKHRHEEPPRIVQAAVTVRGPGRNPARCAERLAGMRAYQVGARRWLVLVYSDGTQERIDLSREAIELIRATYGQWR